MINPIKFMRSGFNEICKSDRKRNCSEINGWKF